MRNLRVGLKKLIHLQREQTSKRKETLWRLFFVSCLHFRAKPLYHAGMRFTSVILTVIHSDQQDIASISFQGLCIMPFLNLPDCRVSRLFIFQFDHKGRLSGRGERQKYNIRKPMPGGHLANHSHHLHAPLCGTSTRRRPSPAQGACPAFYPGREGCSG